MNIKESFVISRDVAIWYIAEIIRKIRSYRKQIALLEQILGQELDDLPDTPIGYLEETVCLFSDIIFGKNEDESVVVSSRFDEWPFYDLLQAEYSDLEIAEKLVNDFFAK